MALTNHERVGKALEVFRKGLAPFVEREAQNAAKKGLVNIELMLRYADDPKLADKPIEEWDVSGLVKLMTDTWNEVFKRILGNAERNLLYEIRDWRNKWAHQQTISSDDADRALDSMMRMLTSVSSPQADELNKMKMDLRRLIYDEQVRSEKRKSGGTLIEGAATGTLKPWREIITPHTDVASGRYQQAEFAADLWQVHLGEGTDEYRSPSEFFRRTFLTDSLKQLLISGLQRLAGTGGDPVVQLQTNFGGGKTHSMLALYHLCSGTPSSELPGVEEVLSTAGIGTIPHARRVVLVGNKISPGNPVTKEDGTVVRTLWGELAWQLGGREAFDVLRADDEKATNPGDRLREMFKNYGPCLILIDEWVAYARQLHDQGDLPAGGFETQFTFAQALTESAKLAGNCMLVISLPASDTSGSPHTQADDAEVGGERGREALERLRNVIGRLESSWRPASAEEGFEIVRRRLFEPLSGPDSYKQRDVTARAFAEYYRSQSAEFPPACRESDYERRIQAAYPIHPEVFDQLYGGWSTLVKFQRTRGVLRLMAAVIHSLWEKGDHSPIILPAMIPIDDLRVQSELTRYLSDNWAPIIEKDVDGPHSLPLRIDGEQPALGRVSATRRVARSIYLGSAPNSAAAHRGIEDRHIKLGCALPGDSAATFGDALRRLAGSATYLYQDGNRYWYATQPTVTKLADDRAEQLTRNPDAVAHELQKRLNDDAKTRGSFDRIHVMPRSGAEVLEAMETRLVVLSADYAHSKQGDSPAVAAAKAILESRGNAPRLFRNTLVFLAADKTRMQDMDEAIRKYLAWESILAEKDMLDLSPHQVRQAETQRDAADSTVSARLPETYCWLLVPEQPRPDAAMGFSTIRLSGNEKLAVRAAKKLHNEELMVSMLGPSILRKHLDEVPLWNGNHIAVAQLVEHFASYLYLPRLHGPSVLTQAISAGLQLLTWQNDGFAYADSYDETKQRYAGLRAGQVVTLSAESRGLLVKPDIAHQQLEIEAQRESDDRKPPTLPGDGIIPLPDDGRSKTGSGGENQPQPAAAGPKRFHGTVTLDPTRIGRDASVIGEEIIKHLLNAHDAGVKITMEIAAHLPEGADEKIVRTVTENCGALKFGSFGFEES